MRIVFRMYHAATKVGRLYRNARFISWIFPVDILESFQLVEVKVDKTPILL
ncbi:uncharacterized protein PHALS_05460 [Plasmopara halstedii]|uniref:Uncharacterized protein n=1 Tax=Plasmopara halstedii TaxID=4781 RepID=A0A0P1B1B3_PLAHL|nr:uncharacterized protein PHALS_05460 [Plasmopara halstedii]CEG47977.1 hypothetical protein PHALS_05460 [Plasmopara halstedii]|eukprot:XP_024584346.1 hypothetical protein PHALS_05460 [Plasmopara halstedii]